MTPERPVKKLFKIGEVAEYGGLSRQAVNYYTALGILREVGRTKAGHRLYDETVFDRIDRVNQLKPTKTLREISEIFRAEIKAPQAKESDDQNS